MTTAASLSTKSSTTNPFATRFTSPGRLPPLDPSGDEIDLEELLRRFRHHGNRAAIRGPHGSGKSTLLLAMVDRLRDHGLLGGHLRLGRGWWRDVLAVAGEIAACDRGRVLCIDSCERLGGVAAAIACLASRVAGRGLLVTAHGDGSLPTLVSCSTTPQLLFRILDRLPNHLGLIGDTDVEETFEEAGGDLRESLFLLYDRFERSRNCRVRS